MWNLVEIYNCCAEVQANEYKKSENSDCFYIITALIFVMLLNTLIVPTIVKRQIVEVDYGTFLRMIENKQVEKVQVEETQIHFTGIDEDGNRKVFVTGRMEDPQAG